VHGDEDHGSGLIGVIGELELLSSNEILMVPQVPRHRGAPFKEPERGINQGSSHIMRPVDWAGKDASKARFGASRAGLDVLDALRIDATIVDGGQRATLLPRSALYTQAGNTRSNSDFHLVSVTVG
jgi:hypothetical protein